MNCARIAIAVIRRSTDHNQAAIVEALRKAGYHVTDLSGVGQGCPDLLCAKPGSVCLVEVKNKEGRNRFTPAQVDYFASTSCPIYVIRSVNDVINLINGEIRAINGRETPNTFDRCSNPRIDQDT
jgi:hypothetical protein